MNSALIGLIMMCQEPMLCTFPGVDIYKGQWQENEYIKICIGQAQSMDSPKCFKLSWNGLITDWVEASKITCHRK